MRAWFERLSIRTKINALVLAILLPGAGIVAWVLAAELEQAREAARAGVQTLAAVTAAQVQQFLHRAEGLLGRLAQRPLVAAMDPTRCDPMLATLVELNPVFTALAAQDLQGRVVCASAPTAARSAPPRELPWPPEALRNGTFSVSAATQDRSSGRWTLELTHPVRDAAGTVVGVLALQVDLAALNAQLLAATPKSAVVSVVDRDSTLLLRSVDAESFRGQRPKADVVQALQGLREGVVSARGRDGVARLVALQTIAGVDWRVGAGVPESEVYAEYNRTLRRTLVIGLGVALLALLLAWWLSARLFAPVRSLSMVAARVAAGDAAARAAPTGPVDIALVAEQFNRMLDARDASEAALRDSEHRYRTLVDGSPEAISVHRDGKVVYVNPATLRLLRADSAQQIVGRDSISFIHPDHRPAVQAQADHATDSHAAVPLQVQTFVRCDGSPVEVEVQVTPILYAGQWSLFASMRDITARRQAEAALRLTEARLLSIFEADSSAILTADDSQAVVMANPAAAAMFGHPMGALVGMPLEQLMPARFRAAHAQDVRAFGRHDGPARPMGRSRDVMVLHRDGREFPVEAAISHLNVEGQRLYTVVLRDISARRRAEAALRDSEARLRRLLTLLPDAVLVHGDDRITFVNEAAQRLFGAPEAAFIGQSPLAFLPPDSSAIAMSRILARGASGAASPLIEEKVVRSDGTSRTVEITVTLIEGPGAPAVLTVLRDVTELKRAQSALAASHTDLQRLLSAQDSVQEEERKRIARELHDDLQQTLAAIRIDLRAAGDRLGGQPAPVMAVLAEADQLAGQAIASTRRIVNDLRPQMLEDLGLVPALETLAGQFSQRSGIACDVQEHDNASEALMESPSLVTCLYRVTQEALNNVVKHSQASRVVIRLGRAGGGRVLLHIRDNGRGMRASDRLKLASFGLMGMYERVRAHGGVLRITSVPGAGTTVEVLAPVGGGPPVLEHEPAPADRSGAAVVPDSGAGELDDGTTGGRPLSRAAGKLLQGVIDALDGNVAVIDRDGVMRYVNRAWREFGERNGAPDPGAIGPGVNYLAVCRSSALLDRFAQAALDGLAAVIDGRLPTFVGEYPCHAPGQARWFRMHAAPMPNGDILVTHVEITPAEHAPRAAG